MKTRALAALVVLGIIDGCGNTTNDVVFAPGTAESPAAEQLPAERALPDLTTDEYRDLCDWFLDRLGGDGATFVCGDTSLTIASALPGCQPTLGCVALVGDVRSCAADRLAVVAACNPSVPSSCQPLGDACGFTIGVTTSPALAPTPTCTDGEQQRCGCADGASGAQICTAGSWGACECTPGCTPGATLPCTCGALPGSMTCAPDGTPTGQCICDTPEPPTGTCVPAQCPDPGIGNPCCMAADGPCGADVGLGCDMCIVGEALPCTCASGARGSASCLKAGEWSTCNCGA